MRALAVGFRGLLVIAVAFCGLTPASASAADVVSWTLPKGEGSVAIWFDGRLMVVNDREPSTLPKKSGFSEPSAPKRMKWSPDGTLLTVIDSKSANLVTFIRVPMT